MDTKTDVETIEQPRQLKSVIRDMADRYGMEPAAFEAALRATVVPKDCSQAQFAAFLLVAKEYGLNPLTKEIYAFPARGGGIVPIVSVDGWVNLVNSQGQCDGFDFEMEREGDKLISCTCSMYRKDRSHPVVVTEYFSECYRPTDPWKMKHRMLRHKALIQAARYAFGFSGIYDEDEGAKIAEIDPNRDAGPPRGPNGATPEPQKPVSQAPAAPPSDLEQARDAAPPRRPETAPAAPAAPPQTPPKADPITTGPQPEPEPGLFGGDEPDRPHEISSEGDTYESWSAKYIDAIKTAPDTRTLMAWGDANTKNLAILRKKMPSVSGKVDTAIKRVAEALEAAKEEAAKQAAAKRATKAELAASDENDDAPQDPDSILEIIDQELGAVEDPDQIEGVLDRICAPLIAKLDFPPDRDLAQACIEKHEKRLGMS